MEQTFNETIKPENKSKEIFKRFSWILLVIALLGVFAFGYWSGKSSVVCKFCKPENIDFSLFWEALDTAKKSYVDANKFDDKKIVYGAISGMLQSLGDPYTVFFTPEDNKSFMDEVTGSFEGVGMEIGIKKGQLQVVAPIDGMPAQKAGLRAGDKILKIDKTFTNDLTVEEAVAIIRGPKGTQVTLSIYRDGWNAAKDIKVTRAVIDVKAVKWQMKEGDIAYINLSQFTENSDGEFRKAANEIANSSAKKIILDLRNDPGGYLEVAQSIAGWFIQKGQTVVAEDFGEKREKEYLKANGNAKFLNIPVVILINEGSASASEILAAAIRENRDNNAKLVGKTSFGKGSVQEIINLTDGSSVKVTVAKWLTPKGNTINEVGIKPDIESEIADEDYASGNDPQLSKALEIARDLK